MDASKKHDKPSPYVKANFFSKMSFWWLKDLLLVGYRRDLEVEDLYNTLPQDDSARLGDRLERKWLKEKSQKSPNLRRAILQTFWADALDYSIFYLLYSCLFRVGQALFLCFLIDSFRQENINPSNRIWYAVGLLSCSLGCVTSYTHFLCRGNQCGMRIRVALCSLMYRKVLCQSRIRTEDSAPIQVVNLMANDTKRFDDAPINLSGLYTPLQVIVITTCAWSLMGISAVIGVLALVLLTAPLQILFGHLSAVLRAKVAEKTDRRVQLLNEIIAGIQLIKMYAWETPFFKMVQAIRISEMRSVLYANYVRGNVLSSLLISDRIALVFTLLPYILLGNNITAAKVYAVAEMYNAMKLGLAYYLPLSLTTIGECIVSIERIQKFLLQEDMTEREASIKQNEEERGAVMLDDVTTGWAPHVDALCNISLDIRPGTLCAVVGHTGAGKSSLLQTLLGELPIRQGSMSVSGTVSFCSQEAWLFSATIRRNILFGQEYDELRYNEVLRVCALERDLRYLPQGDGTLVGEKGAALSGGQRARINLARAVYQKADIYLLDNPLAAVDTQVAHQLLNECICGFLKNTTRFLVVHQPQYIKQADLVIALAKGCVEGVGTYQEIRSKTEAFSHILDKTDDLSSGDKEYLTPEISESTEEEEMKKSSDEKDEESETAELLVKGRLDRKVYSKYFLAGSSAFRVATMVAVFVIGQGLVCTTDWWTAYWTNQEDLRRTIVLPATSPPLPSPPLPPSFQNISHEIPHHNSPRKNISASEKILRALEILDTLDMKYVLNNLKHVSHDADHPLPDSLQGWNTTTSTTDSPFTANTFVPISPDVSSVLLAKGDLKRVNDDVNHTLSALLQDMNTTTFTTFPAVIPNTSVPILQTEANLKNPQGNPENSSTSSANLFRFDIPNPTFTNERNVSNLIEQANITTEIVNVNLRLKVNNQAEATSKNIMMFSTSLLSPTEAETRDLINRINATTEHKITVSDTISKTSTSAPTYNVTKMIETDQEMTQNPQPPGIVGNSTHTLARREVKENGSAIQEVNKELNKSELNKIHVQFPEDLQNKLSTAPVNSTTDKQEKNSADAIQKGDYKDEVVMKIKFTDAPLSDFSSSGNAALMRQIRNETSIFSTLMLPTDREDSNDKELLFKVSNISSNLTSTTGNPSISSTNIKSLSKEINNKTLPIDSEKSNNKLSLFGILYISSNLTQVTNTTVSPEFSLTANITKPSVLLTDFATSNDTNAVLFRDFNISSANTSNLSVNKTGTNYSATSNSINGLLFRDFIPSSAVTPNLETRTNSSFNQLKSPVTSIHNSTVLIDKRYPYFNATRREASQEEEAMTSQTFLWIYASFVGITLVVIVWRTNFYMEVLARSSKGLHKKMLCSVLTSPKKFFDSNPSGRIMNRFTKDLGIVDEGIPFTMLIALQNTTVALGIVILVAIQNSWTLIPFVLAACIFWKMSQLYLATADDVRRLEGVTRSPVFSHLAATIDGLATIRAAGMSHLLRHEFDSLQNQHTAAWTLTISTGMFLNLWADLTCTFFMACIIVLFLVVADDMPSGTVGLALSQTLVLLAMTSIGITTSTIVANMMVSVERLIQYTELEPEPGSEPEAGQKSPGDWPSFGGLEVENLDMSYTHGGPLILKDINLNIQPGEKIGVVGRTGAGKSSLAIALFRMAYWRGSIKIDGEDISRLALNELRQNISIIPQNPVLFSASVRVNLDPTGTIPDVELWEALAQVELKEAIPSLDMALSEAGSNLSVGQRQLLCLARVILRKNKILVLDEATANVDPRTDALIQKSIRHQFQDCTVLSIAHRLNNIMDSDRVLVLDEGHIEEYDHPHVLLQNSHGFLSKLLSNMDENTAELLRQMAAEAYKELQSRQPSRKLQGD